MYDVCVRVLRYSYLLLPFVDLLLFPIRVWIYAIRTIFDYSSTISLSFFLSCNLFVCGRARTNQTASPTVVFIHTRTSNAIRQNAFFPFSGNGINTQIYRTHTKPNLYDFFLWWRWQSFNILIVIWFLLATICSVCVYFGHHFWTKKAANK